MRVKSGAPRLMVGRLEGHVPAERERNDEFNNLTGWPCADDFFVMVAVKGYNLFFVSLNHGN